MATPPAKTAIGFLDVLDLLARREYRLAHAPRVDASPGKELAAHADATHVQALGDEGLELITDDELGAAAADVDRELPAHILGGAVGDAQVDEPGFLAPGDDLDGVAEGGLEFGQQDLLAPRPAQRVGADGTHVVRRHVPQPLPEAFQHLEGAVAGFLVQLILVVQARGEAHGVAHAVDDGELPVDDAGNLQVEAVRAEVDGGNDLGRVYG
jgi:hypothetical protein